MSMVQQNGNFRVPKAKFNRQQQHGATEQHQRGENAEDANHQLVNNIVKLVGACGITIHPTDISICHRMEPKLKRWSSSSK